MSDKGFGDHINRGVVKNPLLSTAVTGLSIEDLTHNTVLLPAVPNQELITRQDKQYEQPATHTATLANTNQTISNFPSGDANSNTIQPNIFTNVDFNTSQIKKDSQNNEIKEILASSTKSKASVKSDDDFDVNEYFARLQGSRYVSAPLSSIIKEDQNANLQAVEENLEEINLNEPDKVWEGTQQSLTADIAQNFSQLPTVLPQVASAVFSSFSNMLSLKSRDTPDVGNVYRPEETVPLGVPDAQKSVAPPPLKEPPPVGTSNYRITTKKKVYAQIPGLTGEAQNNPYNPHNPQHQTSGLPTSTSAPQNIYNPQTDHGAQLSDYAAEGQNISFNTSALPVSQAPYFVSESFASSIESSAQNSSTEKKESVYNFFTPLPETKSSHELQHQHETFPSKTGSSVPHTVQTTPQIQDTFQPDSSMTFMPIPSSTATIIPPPPMFSNVPRSDSQGSVGRTVLPPSVARRISAKQPVISSQPPPMSMQGNIFVPTFTDAYQSQMNTSINQSEIQVIQGNVPQFFKVSATNINSSSDFMLSQSTTSIGGIETSVPIIGPTFDMHTDTKSSIPPSQPIKHLETDIFMQENIHVTQNTRPEMTNIQQTSNLSHPQSIYPEPKTVHPESATPESQKALSMTSQPVSPFFSHPMPPVSSSIQPPKASDPIALELQSSTSSKEQSIDLVEKSLSVLNEPSPLFYDPTSMTQQKSHIEKTLPQVFAQVNIDQYFIQNSPPSDPLKTVIEPPKITGNLNLRMTKKRPQYYSGPIEGVGSISNNIKPTLNPVPYDTFQGALFTPSQPIPENVTEAQNITPNIDAPTLFDSSNVVPPYSHPSLPREEYQTHYNTVFDLSRPTTEKYDQAQPEPEPAKGFGLLGSLKSKLSSLDINKIQNTVTTFFDPAYNEGKEEHTLKQESSYPNQTYGNEYSKDSSTYDIFVGDYNKMQPASSYLTNNYSTEFQHANVHVQESLPEKQSMMDIAWRDNSSVFVDQSDIHHPSYSQANLNSIGSTIGSGIAAFKNTSVVPPFKNDYNNYATFNYSNVSTTILENTTSNMAEYLVNKSNTTSVCSVPNMNNPLSLFSAPFVATESLSTSLDDKIVESVTNLVLNSSPSSKDIKSASRLELIEKPISEPVTLPPIENTFKLFDSHPLLPSDENVVSETTFIIKDDIESEYEIRTQNIFDSFENSPIPDLQSSSVENNFNVLHSKTISNVTQNPQKEVKGDDTLFKYFEKPTAEESTHLFDFSNHSTSTIPSTVSAFDELSGIENKHESMVLHEPQSHILSESTQAFANIDEELAENVSELNICVTCREVAKPEEKEAEDLTTQLIENIVAPIQLLNPVGAALAESEQGQEISKIATIDPLSEISHSTEEVIDDVPIHSVTELLSDVNIDDTVPNYGWNTSDINDILNTNTFVEHDYSLQPDPSAIGFHQNKLLFFENIPTNASDEIKAEFNNSHEDPEIILRHIEIPTAPPDEDSKSDESGLDVLSIEQDAKKDFPIYDDFVIEPSETDDDKIEYMERENNTEEFIPEVDTFTNRVERFKLMETVDSDEVFESQAMITTSLSIHSPTSPAITIASYFDTGNYAVENHYRNSLTSPTALNFLTSFTTSSMRIPPGFEKEYQRRLSGISSDILPDSSHNNVKYVPDTSTQTTSSTTITYSQSPVYQGDGTHVVTAEIKPSSVIETILTKPIEEPITADVERLPAFSSLTGQSKETIENKDEENDDNLTNLPKAEAKTLPDPMNFFTSDAGTSDKEDEYNNYSRLSSYFASPPKSDNAKSFFELSQSQNHYRHASIENEVRNYLDTKNNDTHKDLGITQTRYNETMNLIRDLANYRDPSPNVDIVRTVNYFTVELDIHKSNDSIGEPSASVKITDKDVNRIENNNTRNDNLSNEDVVRKCKNCCNLNTGRVIRIDLECVDCKFRKCMDSGEDGKGEINMDAKSEGHKQTVTVNFMEHSLREEADDGVAILSENRGSSEYSPVKYHWFYRVDKDGNSTWRGFSVADSRALENAFTSSELTDQTVVPTDGGRYDVNVCGRLRLPVYWNEKPTNVRRCSWFYKGNTDARYVPYTEPVAEKLEEEYRHGVTTGEWHRRLVLPNNELVVMHGPAVMVHFLQTIDSFSSSPQSATRPRVVRRGCVEAEIEDTEPSRVDHLLLLCHGVGSACDMRMRALEAVVNDFRSTSLQLLQSHYKNSYDSGLVGRIEVLPISWHSRLHSNETGVDRRLANVTLESIPWLRGFTNDTILDVLFYTSPVYCQTIIDTVCSEMNRIYGVFRQRNPDFKGGVSLGGHSLGSVILYDLLGHQLPAAQSKGSTDKTYVQGYTGKGQPTVQYPQLDFHPAMMFALGSPIAIFECIRGVELLGQGFSLPTCNNFFNIFHPYDPIAYRIEPMIDPGLKDVKPYLIPHHKGRKRMHLELKDTMARFGADIKQKLIESIKSTWSSVWKTQPLPSDQLEKVMEEEMEKEELTEESKADTSEEKQATPEMLGTLNGGRRVDYVLQEAPFEMINEYLFAMTSHVCYWESEDTILLILREIYDSLKVQPDCSVPQQSMSVQRTRTVDHDGVIITGSTDSPSTSRGAS